MHVRIRPAEESDIPVLTGLIRRAFSTVAERFALTPDSAPTHPSNITDVWIQRDFTNHIRYFIAEDDSGILGCMALETAHQGNMYLERLAVRPDACGGGIGSGLVRYALEKAREEGARSLSIGIIAEDLDLGRWYERRGFVESGRRWFRHLPFEVRYMSVDLEPSDKSDT